MTKSIRGTTSLWRIANVTVHGSEPIEAAGGEKIDLDLNRRFESQRWHDACAH